MKTRKLLALLPAFVTTLGATRKRGNPPRPLRA